jgi:hypothetical protein
MPMREECKHFESRTYADGETARKCQLDLAPEAPWRCPEDCTAFERRLADVNWQHGDLIEPALEDEPEGEGIAELLDEAEDIVNAAGPDIVAEVEAQDRRQYGDDGGFGGRVKRLFRRKG